MCLASPVLFDSRRFPQLPISLQLHTPVYPSLCFLPEHKPEQPFLYTQLTIYTVLSGIRYPCTRSILVNHMRAQEECLIWYNSERRHFVIYPFCDFKTLFHLAMKLFGRVCIFMAISDSY